MSDRISASTLRGTSKQFKREEIFLLFSEPVGSLIAVNEYQQEMKDCLNKLENANVLLASGPLLSADGESHNGASLTIIDVAGIEEAGDIARCDPWAKRGLREIAIKPMLVGQGVLYSLLKQK